VADPDRGVFDTMLARDGVVVDGPAHLGRLASSVRRLYGVPLDLAELTDRVADAVAGAAGWQRVRVTYEPRTDDGRPRVATQPLPSRSRGPWTLEVHRVAGGLGEHKWLDRSLVDAWRRPAEPDTDALLVDEESLLLETGRGNVFVVRDGLVATPPLDGRILPGVVRARVVAALGRLGIRCLERVVTLAELAEADEVFVTNAIGGVRPVAACRDVGAWLQGPVTRAADDEVEAGRVDT
jgi:para-aminobenzoate synthetase/4-amino-4-deoxychorismate lyase